MMLRRAWFAAPAAVAIVLAVIAPAAADPIPVDDLDVVVVQDVSDLAGFIAGLEVSGRTITWGVSRTMVGPDNPSLIEANAFTPDLGGSPLTVGAVVTPPISNAMYVASTADWAVGFDPYAAGVGSGYGLWIKPAGGTSEMITLPSSFNSRGANLSVWGDTALVGDQIINLNTREITIVEDLNACLSADAGALADGALVLKDTCDGGLVVASVPADGFTADALDDLQILTADDADRVAVSRGLVVWTVGDVVRWARLADPATAGEASLPWGAITVRLQGERFVVGGIAADGDGSLLDVWVFDAATAEADGPIVALTVPTPFNLAPVTPAGEHLAAAVADPSSDMALDILPIDLFGRTLAWWDGAAIVATTLPALAGGAPAAQAPASATVGTPVTVAGTGFLALEEVAIWLGGTLLGTAYAGADGTFSASVTVPAGAAAGAGTVTLAGVESGWTALAPIVLAAAANPGLRVDTGR